MAKMKNKDLLVRRAKWHAEQDHIKQGTYGDASINGQVEFQGCAITCLATPHGKRGLRQWLRAHLGRDGSMGSTTELDANDPVYLLRQIKGEFGIPISVMRVAEAVFESLPTHGAAIEFIPEFAKALPADGTRINHQAVVALYRKWEREYGLLYSYGGDYLNDSLSFSAVSHYGVGRAKRELLELLRSM